jgi:hypothetical protein
MMNFPKSKRKIQGRNGITKLFLRRKSLQRDTISTGGVEQVERINQGRRAEAEVALEVSMMK